jgi:RNA polymerase sigma-70 factor (ECF subfamily)
VFEEYSHKEIAEILGISEGTSKSNLAKARMNVQKMLETTYKKIAQ